MNKFKIGDKAKRISGSDDAGFNMFLGDINTVEGVITSGIWSGFITFKGQHQSWDADNIELVEEKQVKVKVIRAGLSSYWYANSIGKTFDVVECTNGGFTLKVNDPSLQRYFDASDVEIINEEKKQMKKSDLRTGDLIVTTDNGGIVRVYLGTTNGDIVAGSTWFPLKEYTDERLFGWSTPSEYGGSFLEVWRPKCNKDFRNAEPSEYTHELIWKKEQQTPEQKQLQEVMDKISDLTKQAEKLQGLINKC